MNKTLQIGTLLQNGRYKITRHLADGGFGSVYQADNHIGQLFAIKENFCSEFVRRSVDGISVEAIPSNSKRNLKIHKHQCTRAKEEAELFGHNGVRHPNLVPIIDFFYENNTAYLVMPYIDGQPIDIFSRNRKLSELEVLEIIEQLSDVLFKLHEHGYIHRDIKPANIILTEINNRFIPILLDTGAARTFKKADSFHTGIQTTFGAPEIVSEFEQKKYGNPGPGSDCFALAGLTYFLLTNEFPPAYFERVYDINEGKSDPLVRPSNIDYDKWLVIEKSLSLYVADRHGTGKDFYESLKIAFQPQLPEIQEPELDELDIQEPPIGTIEIEENKKLTCGYCFNNTLKNGVCSNCGKVEQQRDARSLGKTYLNSKYFVGSTLGQPGGFGIAYLAYDIVLKRKVVIKELFPNNHVHRQESNHVVINQQGFFEEFENHKSLFLDEARKLAQLSDINSVVNIIDFFSENNTAYFVMPFVEGQLLSEYIQQHGALDQNKLIDWFYRLSEGLVAIHANDIYHRDIKPDNIIIDKNNNPILIDFGNAVSEQNKTNVSYLHALTPSYAAPEQHAKRDSDMGAWTDVYSLGATMYYCGTDKKPESAENLFIREENLIFSSLDAEYFSKDLINIIEHCTKLRINERVQKPDEILAVLTKLKEDNVHWTSLLSNSSFARRMRLIHSKKASGSKYPISFNLLAGFTQWYWFYSKGLFFIGTLNVSLFILAICIGWLIGIAPNDFIVVCMITWAVLFIPVSLVANFLQYTNISNKLMDADIDYINHFLDKCKQINFFGVQLGIVFSLLIACFFLFNFVDFKEKKLDLHYAIIHPELREDFSKYYQDFGYYPDDVETLDQENPNSEYSFLLNPSSRVGKVEFINNEIEITLSFFPFENQRITWTLYEDVRWKCSSSEIDENYLPDYCEKTEF